MSDATGTLDEKRMPLFDHLVELRQRLLYCVLALIVLFFGCFAVAEHIYAFLVQPLADALRGQPNAHMVYTALHEAFFTYVKVAFFAALFLAFPVILSQVWLFVAPGLYRNERRAFLPFLAATPVLFLLGGALVYFMIMPLAWKFFLGFQTTGAAEGLPIEALPKVGEYLSLVMTLIFAFGIGFQLPVLLLLLARVGLVSSRMLAEKRRYAIVGVFIVAAVLTPPDVISQIGLALPILLLYEASIWGARIIERKRAEAEAQADSEPEEPE